MFLPISPSPPRGRTRSAVTLRAVRAARGLESSAHGLELRVVARDQGRRRPPTSTPIRFSAALTGAGGGDEHGVVDVTQRRVDLARDSRARRPSAHLVADDVAGDEDAARSAEVEVREACIVAGVDRRPSIGEGRRRWPA
jgi:hypothetical protein